MSEIVDTLVHVAPMKVLQEASRIFFNLEAPIERPHSIPLYNINRLGLKLDGLEHIYDEINQSQVARNDNAAANTKLWDDAALKIPFNCDDEIDFILRGKTMIMTSKLLILFDLFSPNDTRRM